MSFLRYLYLANDPKKPKRVVIPVKQLGLATGQIVYVSRNATN